MSSVSQPLLVTRDPNLAEVVLASAAALGRDLLAVAELGELRRWWRSSALVLVGVDAAELVRDLGLPPRPQVYLIGSSAAELARWSAPLGASVVVLPDTAGVLASLLVAPAAAGGAGAMWVLGAGGGLGCSTLVAALATVAARDRRVAVVELDPYGGLDLIFGAESQAGWRWPDLAAAAGQVGDLSGRVLRAGDVDLVAMGRGGYVQPSSEATAAVLGSLHRSHDLVIADGGRSRPVGSDIRVLLVVGADVRSVAAARALAGDIDIADAEVVVRTGPGRSIAPGLVADALGLPLGGALPTDASLPRMLEAGRAPGASPGRYRKAVEHLLKGNDDARP